MTTKAVAVAADQPPQPPAPQSDSAAILSMIDRAARDPSVDIDKWERLIAMQERITAREAERAFNAAMATVQAALKPVVRKLANTQTRSTYADLAAISEAADPIIHGHGFGVICSEFRSQVPDHLGIRCEITHAEGHSRAYEFNIPMDGAGLKGNANKTPTHAYGSTITYGRRYAKCSVFDIATKNDNDGNALKADGPITGEQAEELSKLITETQTEIDLVLQFHKVESLSDMTAADYRTAKAKLVARKQHLAKEANRG